VAAYNSDGSALNTIFPNFDFSGFFLYPQARAVANPPADVASTLNSVLWRFKRFGPDGNKARISYTNPTAPSQDFGVTTAQGDLLDVFISCPPALRAPSRPASGTQSSPPSTAAARTCGRSATTRASAPRWPSSAPTTSPPRSRLAAARRTRTSRTTASCWATRST
jgi:hypothetical protein